MGHFYKKLHDSCTLNDSLLCVGLDPDITKLPKHFQKQKNGVFQFNKAIIDATANMVCAFKPQIAYYAAIGAEDQLQSTIDYIKSNHPGLLVILDAKRGDIGSTAKMYAVEAFERYSVDAVTVNPYMGSDTLQPFLDYQDHGVIVLCRTSNPGSGDFQDLKMDGTALYEQVATKATNQWNDNENVALVVGATYPKVIGRVRSITGNMPLLVPGVGTQGGDLEQVLKYGLTPAQNGLLINVSRGVIHASSNDDFADVAATKALAIQQSINLSRR